MADDWIAQLMREYQDVIIRGAYAGICQLSAQPRDRVMACQAQACAAEFVKLYDLPAQLDLDTFLTRMRTAGPSKIDIQRHGDTILWTERHDGECICPLVRRAVVALTPVLCTCAVHWLRTLIERHARRPARVELIDSVATGNANCVFRITLGEA